MRQLADVLQWTGAKSCHVLHQVALLVSILKALQRLNVASRLERKLIAQELQIRSRVLWIRHTVGHCAKTVFGWILYRSSDYTWTQKAYVIEFVEAPSSLDKVLDSLHARFQDPRFRVWGSFLDRHLLLVICRKFCGLDASGQIRADHSMGLVWITKRGGPRNTPPRPLSGPEDYQFLAREMPIY